MNIINSDTITITELNYMDRLIELQMETGFGNVSYHHFDDVFIVIDNSGSSLAIRLEFLETHIPVFGVYDAEQAARMCGAWLS